MIGVTSCWVFMIFWSRAMTCTILSSYKVLKWIHFLMGCSVQGHFLHACIDISYSESCSTSLLMMYTPLLFMHNIWWLRLCSHLSDVLNINCKKELPCSWNNMSGSITSIKSRLLHGKPWFQNLNPCSFRINTYSRITTCSLFLSHDSKGWFDTTWRKIILHRYGVNRYRIDMMLSDAPATKKVSPEDERCLWCFMSLSCRWAYSILEIVHMNHKSFSWYYAGIQKYLTTSSCNVDITWVFAKQLYILYTITCNLMRITSICFIPYAFASLPLYSHMKGKPSKRRCISIQASSSK